LYRRKIKSNRKKEKIYITIGIKNLSKENVNMRILRLEKQNNVDKNKQHTHTDAKKKTN